MPDPPFLFGEGSGNWTRFSIKMSEYIGNPELGLGLGLEIYPISAMLLATTSKFPEKEL